MMRKWIHCQNKRDRGQRINRFPLLIMIGIVWVGLLSQPGTGLYAQNDGSLAFSPLLSEETTVVCKINVDHLDSNLIGKKVNDFIAPVIDSVSADKDDAKKKRMAASLVIASVIAPFSQFAKTLQAEGIHEIYYLSTPETSETSFGYIAIPTGEKTKEELTAVKKDLLNLQNFLPMRTAFVRHGFMIAPFLNKTASDESFRDYARQKFSTLHPVERPRFSQIFADYPDATICYAFVGNPKTFKEFNDSLEEAQQLTEGDDSQGAAALSKVLATELGNFTELIDSSAIVLNQDSSIEIKVYLNSKASTNTIQLILDNIRSGIVNAIDSEETEKELVDDQRTLIGNIYDALLPEISKDSLKWRFDKDFLEKNRPLLDRYFQILKTKREKEMGESIPTTPTSPAPSEATL